ncbi:MAG TPA: hypothetical protein IGS52_16205 [Oscillatoriaceae cyanobacterium M33_DOE_052]|uniref:Uncharacterized protein n=1 Tax=Planktothricoides sp. SpSt-374 TaxID=2282167 RepID=A0A7C4A098_9CYAN|nr:hypothetical protein [Oscillatoriaceae cyanobacterium M33_DOE_052]
MEDWPTNFFTSLEYLANHAAKELDSYLLELTDDVNEAVEGILRSSEETISELTRDLQDFLGEDMERFFQEFIDPQLDYYVGVTDEEQEPEPLPFVTYVAATPAKNPACIGCENYHGYVYNGNLMVCGMHPYGWDGEECPDFLGMDYQEK